jgi:hypothetical protein
MKYIYIMLAILFLGVMACEKEDLGGGSEEQVTTQDLKIVELNGYKPSVSTRSGEKLPIFYRVSFTTNNYLQTAQAGYISTQYTFNKDSVEKVIFKRSGENVNIAGVMHGTYNVSVVFLDQTTHEDKYFVKQGPNYYELYPSGTNYYTQINNYNKVERLDTTVNYYDYRFGKFKNKYQYRVAAPDTTKLEFIPSTSANQSIFSLTHVI